MDRENRTREGIYVAPGAGKTLWVTDELMTFKVMGEDTGGKYALTDSIVPPGGGPPPHIHHREDEAFWVLEGELEIRVGEETFTAGAGSFIHLPRGVTHSYQNVGTGLARFLTFLAPAGLERFFIEFVRRNEDAALGLTAAQLWSLLLFVLGLVGLALLQQRGGLLLSRGRSVPRSATA